MKTKNSSILFEVSNTFERFMYSEIYNLQKELEGLKTNHDEKDCFGPIYEICIPCEVCAYIGAVSDKLGNFKRILRKFRRIQEEKLKTQ